VRLNETLSKNNVYKEDIDTLRKELISTQLGLRKLNSKINKSKNESITSNQDYTKGKAKAEETNNRILALKAKHENEKNKFEYEIKRL
jgi:chromosome segregation ATPase